MKTLIVILTFLPFFVWGQKELKVEGKMIYAETKNATLTLVENGSDTTTIQITKKKFSLPSLNAESKYDLIFKCGEQTKSITLNPQTEGENKHHVLELDWTK